MARLSADRIHAATSGLRPHDRALLVNRAARRGVPVAVTCRTCEVTQLLRNRDNLADWDRQHDHERGAT